MADRTVVTRLVLDIAGYSTSAVEASKSTTALATAQKEAAAAARDAGVAQRDAGFAARDAAATASASAQAMAAAQKEAAAASKEAAAAEVTAAKATTDADRLQAEAVAQTAAERAAAAKEALANASAQAEADAAQASAARAGALEAAKYAAAQRDVAVAAKEAAASESTAAKESVAASAERADAYKSSGKALTTMALVGGAAIGLMVKDAGNFQSSTQHLVTDAGESQDKLAMVQAGILKTAAATGTGATALVDAMYHIESAGFHGQAGLDMLTVSAEGAKVGAADLGTVAKTLTGTMNSYSTAGYSNVQMMNMLIATTAAGDMKLNDLAGSLGNVAPGAAAAKISFAEVGGAIATMTSQNMSADRATQDLNSTINSLQKPNNVAINQMQALGLSSNDVSENLGKRGLTGTLEMLTTAVANHTQNGQVFIDTLKNSQNAAADADTMIKQLPVSVQQVAKGFLDGSVTAAEYNKAISGLDGSQQHMAKQFETLVKNSGSFNDLLKSGKPEAETFNAAMSNMLGGATGLNTALMLTGGRMQTFKDNAAAIQAAANKGGTEVDNWAKIQQTFNQKIEVAKASLGAMGIAIGTTLLPVVAELAKWVTAVVTPIAEWVNKNQALTAIVLGSATAVAALILAINGAIKVAGLVKNAIEGVRTAVEFFSKSSQAAAIETEALGAAQAATAKETNAAAVASTTAAVKAEALGAANSAAAAETDAAALSTGGWAAKLGGSIPIIGTVVIGAMALGNELNKVADGADKAGPSVDQWTTSLLNSSATATTFGTSAEQAQKMLEGFGGKANAAIEPTAAIGVVLAKQGQMMGDGAKMTKNYDDALAALVSGGHADRAAALMAEIASATNKQGVALVNTQKDFPQYWAALDKNAANQALAKNATTDATGALGANAGALDANAAATLGAADATGTLAGSTSEAAKAAAAQTAASKASALQAYQSSAAWAALGLAQNDEAAGSEIAAAAHAKAAGSVAGNATATRDATTAAKDHTAATAKDATAAKDATKANADQSKAASDAAKADQAATAAANAKAAADAAGGNSAKLNATAKRDAAAATRAATVEDNANARAAAAAGTAHDAAGRAIDAHTKAVDASAKAASDAAKAAGQDQAAQDAAAESARQAAQSHELGTKWLLAVADAEEQASGGAEQLDGSVKDEINSMKDAKTAASDLKDGLDALNGVHIAASRAAVDVQQKIADLTKALHDNGKTLDITTDAGRKNITAIDDLATAANAHAQAVAEESGSIQAGNKALDASRAEFDAVLKAAGYSTDQIDAFNKTLLNTPKLDPVTIQVKADTSGADASLSALEAKYGATGLIFGGHHVGYSYATGGLVTGPGGPTSDSVPVNASAGEYIVKASAVAQPGVKDALDTLNFGHGTATIVKPMLPMRSLGAGGGGHGGGNGGGGTVQVELVSGGAEDYFLRFMRHAIRLRGGNVQSVLGS